MVSYDMREMGGRAPSMLISRFLIELYFEYHETNTTTIGELNIRIRNQVFSD